MFPLLSASCDISGASCEDGASFNPIIENSVWVSELVSENHMYRLQLCPPGYEFHRDDVSPDQDQCVICPSGKYLLESTNSIQDQCLPCPVGNDSLQQQPLSILIFLFLVFSTFTFRVQVGCVMVETV